MRHIPPLPPLPARPFQHGQDHRGPWRRALPWLLIGAVFLLFIYAIRGILLPFVIGILTGYLLDPLADRLERRGMNRGVATLLLTAGFFVFMGVLVALLAPPLVHQATALLTTLPEYIHDLRMRYSDTLNGWLQQFTLVPEDGSGALKDAAGSLLSAAGAVLIGVVSSGAAIVNIVSLLLLAPLVAFYTLRDWDVMVARIDALLPRAYAETIREQLAAIDATLAGFLRGQLNVCLILAVYYAISLSLTGLNFGLIIGFLAGILVILPYIGFLFSFGIALVVAYLQFGFEAQFWVVAAIFGIAQLLESYFLTPRMVGNRVGLHPLWIIFGMLAGGTLLGFVGVLLAVPLTAIAGVLTRFAIARYRDSALYSRG